MFAISLRIAISVRYRRHEEGEFEQGDEDLQAWKG